MKQRSEPRFAADQAVWVTRLTQVETRIAGYIRNASGRGLGLAVGEAIAPGTPLKIDIPDGFLLGEAIYCRPQDDRFYVGVELEDALYGLAELAKIMNEFPERRACSEPALARSRKQAG